jgi:hypothetical protein
MILRFKKELSHCLTKAAEGVEFFSINLRSAVGPAAPLLRPARVRSGM